MTELLSLFGGHLRAACENSSGALGDEAIYFRPILELLQAQPESFQRDAMEWGYHDPAIAQSGKSSSTSRAFGWIAGPANFRNLRSASAKQEYVQP